LISEIGIEIIYHMNAMKKVLRVFFHFFLKNRTVALFFYIFVVISPIIGSLGPYFYKLLVDAVTAFDQKLVIEVLLIYIGVRFVHMFIDTFTYYLGDKLAIDSTVEIRQTVFNHIHALDFAFHTTKSSGSLISAIKRGEGAYWDLYFSIHHRIFNVLVSFLVMLYFFREVDMAIFLFALASFAMALLVGRVFVQRNIRYIRDVNKKEDNISAVVVDNMVNFETVKLFAKETWESFRLRRKQGQWKKSIWRYFMTYRYLDVSMGTVINLSVLLMVLTALNLTLRQQIGVGDFVLVVGFTATFYPKIWEFVWGFRQIAKNYTDVERYFGILDQEISVKDPQDPVKLKNILGEIDFEDVSFSYEKNDEDAVKNVNLKLRPGQSIALVGRSGAGKTTIIKLLLRFFDVNKGKITIDGVDIRKLKKSRLRSYMGVVPQEPILFNNTIGYNIAYGKEKVSKKEIVAAAKLANIHDFIETLPKKYRTQVGERGIKLSGGQKQRVAIARMILSDPEIVIFDEATSQLDSESERLIQDAFWKAVYNKTTIIIAHRLSTVMRADKIVVMEAGSIVEMGSHNELVNRKESLYKHFWELQTLEE
jgi:ABC-type multidrug transport system fused ATPase/permease subunit